MTEERKKVQDPKTLDSFKPSWFDKFAVFVDGLPGSYWMAYLVFGGVLAGIGLIVQIFDNSRQFLVFEPLELLILFQIVFVLSLITYLNKKGAKAMEAFRPVFSGTEEEAVLLKLHLTSMPARSINRLSVSYLLVYSVLGYLILRYSGSAAIESQSTLADYVFTRTPYGYYMLVMFAILWLVNVIFIYNTFHQLGVINYALTHKADIKLFRQTELYAFSRILAARSIGFVLTSPIWLVVDRGVITLIINAVFSILALLIFIVPLFGVHRLLERQKDLLLLESSENKESIIYQLLDHLRQGNITETGGLKDGLSSVTLAHDEIKKVSTWPWQTNTIRQIVGAITLPIVIWTIQYFLGRLLGG